MFEHPRLNFSPIKSSDHHSPSPSPSNTATRSSNITSMKRFDQTSSRTKNSTKTSRLVSRFEESRHYRTTTALTSQTRNQLVPYLEQRIPNNQFHLRAHPYLSLVPNFSTSKLVQNPSRSRHRNLDWKPMEGLWRDIGGRYYHGSRANEGTTW